MGPRFVASGRLLAHPRAGLLLATVARVGEAFPELADRRVRLDLLDPRRRMAGLAFPARTVPTIALSPRGLGTPAFEATVAHELTHLLQWPDRLLPQGERACDLYVLARFGTRFVGPPAYLRVPGATRDRWESWAPTAQRLAVAAFEARSRGERRYLAGWEAAFALAVRGGGAPSRGPVPPAGRPNLLSPLSTLEGGATFDERARRCGPELGAGPG